MAPHPLCPRTSPVPRTTLRAAGPAALLLGGAALVLGGCSAGTPERAVFDHAPRWETALPAAGSADALVAGAGGGWWTNRRDATLVGDASRLPTALDRWSEPLPDLRHARYLYLPRSADRMLFLPPTDARHHHHSYPRRFYR